MTIVTLLTDYGTRDAYVAELKGTLLTLAHGVTLVDVTHDEYVETVGGQDRIRAIPSPVF